MTLPKSQIAFVDTRTPEEKERERKNLEAGALLWQKKQDDKAKAEAEAGGLFGDALAKMKAASANLPDAIEIPYEKTPEGERLARFNRTCDDRFLGDVDFTRIRDRKAYDLVVNWDGRSPGPCLTGLTGHGKTFNAWQALRRLYVKQNKPFKWFTARDLVAEMAKYESNECITDFFRMTDFFKIVFVDDIDKINWDFETNANMLFAFVDWIYRTQKPCIVTTNRERAWWKAKCGDAFVRRLFDDGFFEVNFK